MNDVLTFDELHHALTRCMESHPLDGLEFCTHPDGNTIARRRALMNYQQATSRRIDQIGPKVLQAYCRWAQGSADQSSSTTT